MLLPMMVFSQIVSYYTLDANSNDRLGVNNLTDVNSPTYTALGLRGNAATYNGSNQQSYKGAISGFTNGDVSVSIGMWIKSTTSTNGLRIAGGITCNNSAYNSSLGLATFYLTTSKCLVSTYGGDLVAATKLFTSINDGKWHYILTTRKSGAGKISLSLHLYIDGIEQNPYTTLGTDGVFLLVGYWISLGNLCSVSGTYQYGFVGSIDEVKYYKSYLTSAEVRNEYILMKMPSQ